MAKVYFKFDRNKDCWNIWSKVNNTLTRFGKQNISEKMTLACRDKTLIDAEKELTILNKSLYDSELINNFIYALDKSWTKIELEFFARLEKITGKKLEGDFACYITTLGTCPYNFKEKWFMNSLFYSLPKAMSTIGHELLHMHFHEFYFSEVEKQIGTNKTHDLREALTILLNIEFKDLLFGFDEGYEVHKDLREYMIKEWNMDKDFDKLLKKSIMRLKQEGDKNSE